MWKISLPVSNASLAIHEKTIAMIPRMKLQKRQLSMEQARQSPGFTANKYINSCTEFLT